jgi:hypothetical protein
MTNGSRKKENPIVTLLTDRWQSLPVQAGGMTVC